MDKLGILMLDTKFPRLVGDAGNAESWPFAVEIARVRGADVERAVFQDPMVLVESFITEGERLLDAGCCALVTTCGLLAPLQATMAKRLSVPVATSALMQVAWLEAMRPHAPPGVLTIESSRFTGDDRKAMAIPDHVPVVGMEGTHFSDVILNDRPAFDVALARGEHIAAARTLVDANPHIGSIVLECTNMPPYASDIEAVTGRPVVSVLTLGVWLRSAALGRT